MAVHGRKVVRCFVLWGMIFEMTLNAPRDA
jgi:hypothetical protein